jgi:RimJ/RimL family protein N-acetyltransferase
MLSNLLPDNANSVLYYPNLGYSLTPLTERRLPDFLRIRNSVREHLHDKREFSLEEAREWLPTATTSYHLVETANGVIGYIREKRLSHDELQLGVDIAPEFQGMGHGKKIWQSLICYLFSETKLQRISLRVLESNLRAHQLYASLGFQESLELSNLGADKYLYIERDWNLGLTYDQP